MKGYYTAKEAQEKLGVTEDKFQYMVRKEQVQKVILPGRKYGVYPQIDIDELADLLNGSFPHKSETRDIFRLAQPEDTKEMYALSDSAMRLSGGRGVPPNKLLPFLSIPHSEIGHVLLRNNRIMGYFTILPLSHQKLLQRMRDELVTSQILPEEVRPFAPGEKVDCFIWEVISDPDEKHVGAYLIEKMLKFFHTLGKRGVEIEGLYTIASSPEGINLCRRIGMHIMNLPGMNASGNVPFELNIQEQKNRLTKNYIQALRSYRLRQEIHR